MANVSENAGITTSQPVVVSSDYVSACSAACGPESLLDDPFIPRVVELCRTVFPSEVSVESMVDPSEPNDPWLSFSVAARGSYSDILRRESEWHDQVERLTGDRTGRYRICVCPITA